MKAMLKKFSALFVSAAIAAGVMPAANLINAHAAYESKYPDRIADSIVYDGLEDYEVGTTATKIGKAWWDPGNNQNEYAIVGENDGTKVIYYEGQHDYSTFCSPDKQKLTDAVWLDVDVKLPENYTRYHFQIGDFTHPDRALLLFYKDQTSLVASGVQNPAGATSSITLSTEIPQNEWFTLSLWFNPAKERFRVYIDGVQVGDEMNFNYKFNCTTHGTEGPEAGFAKMSFAHRDGAEGFSERLYLDNFRLGYAREIKSVSTMEITVDKGESYTLPSEIELEMDNGEMRSFPVTFTPVGDALDTNTLGAYQYTAQIEHYNTPVDVWVYVKERTISAIDTIYEKVYKGESYTLPMQVKANMSDGGIKYVPVSSWSGEADTSQVGTTVFTGTVDGYGDFEFNLEVLANSVLRADDVYIGVPLGETYTLPSEVNVIFTNHKYGKAAVTWEAGAESVDTSVLTGMTKPSFEGVVEGYNYPIKLYVTVYQDDPDLGYIFDTLVEYYDNCLNIARDRSEYFPEEYAAGYDPATPGIVSDNPHSPLFSMGIDRETNQHAKWPTPSGNRPLAVPATQGPLWKGLLGLTSLIDNSPEYQERYKELHKNDLNDEGYRKYHNSVEEAHGYLINNYVDPSGHMLQWGDHILQEFDKPQLPNQDSTDSYAYMIHQMECDYPEWDILFSQNPEATARYIKAFWVGHFNMGEEGIKLDTMEFTRHTSVNNTWNIELVDNIFKNRYDFDDVKIHEESGKLTFINAAVDYAWAAVKLWQNTGDEDALHYARKLLWCYNEAANEETGLVPFMFTDTSSSNTFVGDVYEDIYMTHFPGGRAKHSYNKVVENPTKYGTVSERVNDSYLLNQGKCGGGSFYMPMLCFDVADIIGGETGAEIEQWGISALRGFVNYTYDYKTGLGKSGMTDGTVLDDYKPEYKSYYHSGGRTQWPITITSDMTWVLLDGYERCQDPKMWECLRSICMSLSLGDIGTAPAQNIDMDIYTDCDDSNIVLTLSRLYEITGAQEYYEMAKRIVKSIIRERFINGFFYKSEIGAYARLADPAPYCILYFLAASEGVSKMLPHYQGESFDFQTNFVQDNGDIDSLYGYSLFNKTIVSEVLPSAVLCDVEEITLSVGEQYTVYAEVFPEDADDVSLEWDTDNTGVCIVEDGYITAIAPGTCIVTAEASSGVRASIKVTVK